MPTPTFPSQRNALRELARDPAPACLIQAGEQLLRSQHLCKHQVAVFGLQMFGNVNQARKWCLDEALNHRQNQPAARRIARGAAILSTCEIDWSPASSVAMVHSTELYVVDIVAGTCTCPDASPVTEPAAS